MNTYDKLTINRLIQNLKITDTRIDIPVEDFTVSFAFWGIYQVDRLVMSVSKTSGAVLCQKIYIQDTKFMDIASDLDALLSEHNVHIRPTDLVGEILSCSNELNKDTQMKVADLIKLVNESNTPVTLNLAKHNFTFGTEDGELKYDVVDPDGETRQYYCKPDITLTHFSSILSDNTKRPAVDEDYSTCANVVSVFRVLDKLVSLGPNFEVDSEFQNLVTHLKRLDEPFTLSYGDELVTTFKYNDNTLHIQSRIPNQFARTHHIGMDGTLDMIIDAICDQYKEVPIPELLPNQLLIKEIIEELSDAY